MSATPGARCAEERRIKASAEEIAASLQGNWRAEHLFALKQALDAFDFCRHAAGRVRRARSRRSCASAGHTMASPPRARSAATGRNAPKFDLRPQLFQMCGVDLTRIEGIDVTTALAVISEIGADMIRFPDVKHFASWLGLCPGTKITGGKTMSGKTKRSANRPPRP